MKRTTGLKASAFKRSERKEASAVAKLRIAKPKERKCAICRNPFEPRSMTHKACGPFCAQEVARVAAIKQKAREQRQERAGDRVKLEKFKTLPACKREAQVAWNKYVRARDAGKPCCSCGATPKEVFGGAMDCSHYRSRGSSPHLSFHLHNAAAACVKCNRFLGGNVVALRAGLIARLGEEKILAVEADNRARHFTKEYLARIKKIFTKKAKRQLSRISNG